MAPRRVKICPGCPSKGLDFDVTPQFNFVPEKKKDTKKLQLLVMLKITLKERLRLYFKRNK